MKKHLLFLWLAVACASSLGHAQTTTTHYGLYKPAAHEKNYGTQVGNNFDIIDSHLYSLSLILPVGSSGQIEYNNAGAFAGFTMSGDCTITTSTGVVICTKTNGVAFAASATTNTANASNISSGTLPDARFPATLPAASGVNLTALNATNLGSGAVPAARMPAMTGDATSSAGAVALTLATVNGSPGTYTNPIVIVNAKGLVTSAVGGGVDGVVTSGLMAQYRMLPSENPCALVDYSGNGNTATGCVGTSPTIIADSGGAQGNAGAISLSAGLNSAVSVQLFFACPYCIGSLIAGGGTQANSDGLFLVYNTQVAVGDPPFTHASRIVSGQVSGSYHAESRNTFQGTQDIAWVMDTANSRERIYVNGVVDDTKNYYSNNGSSAGSQTAGNYQLMGVSQALFGNGSNYFTGKMYYALFYNRVLTPGEVAANSAAMAAVMVARGVPRTQFNTSNVDFSTRQLVTDGDSITQGAGITNPAIPYSTLIKLPGSWQINNTAITGASLSSGGGFAGLVGTAGTVVDPFYEPTSVGNIVVIWGGTNDNSTAAQGGLRQYCNDRHVVGWLCIVSTMVSRVSEDTFKNTYNTWIRQNWRSFADGLADIAADPKLGADAQYADTQYFIDPGIHPTQFAIDNNEAPLFQRAINRLGGASDFSNATTYTSGAAAATAITAASESTNTVTITSTLNPPAGSSVTIAGVTPSGYNGTYNVLTTSATTFTLFNVSGLGAGSVFGTAKIPLQLDGDGWVVLGGSGTSQNFTLETCQGSTGQNIYLKHTNTTSPWVITPSGSETIDGAATLTMPTASSGNNPVVILQSVLVSAAAAGCNWKRMQ